MPAFIHERAKHILAKNPSMPKSEAFGIATQQSHALGKSPKGYGTSEGKAKAKKKYPDKKSYVKGANPGDLKSSKLANIRRMKMAGATPAQLASAYKSGPPFTGSPHSKSPKDNSKVSQDNPDPTDQRFGDELEEVKFSSVLMKFSKVLTEAGRGRIKEKNFALPGDRYPIHDLAHARNALARRSSVEGVREKAKGKKKEAYAVSAYSGPLSYGKFKQESQIPPFRSPPVKTAGPPSQEKGARALQHMLGHLKLAYNPSPLGNVHMPGMKRMQTPAMQLQESKSVAVSKPTRPDATKALAIKLPAIGSPL